MVQSRKKELPSEALSDVPTVSSRLCQDNILVRTKDRNAAAADNSPSATKSGRYPLLHLCGFMAKDGTSPCQTAPKTNVDLVRHEWTHVPKELWPLTCTHCGQNFPQDTHLVQHVTSVHDKKKDANACKCGLEAADPAQITRHLKAVQAKGEAQEHDWVKYKGELNTRPGQQRKSPKKSRPHKSAASRTAGSPDMVAQRPLPQFTLEEQQPGWGFMDPENTLGPFEHDQQEFDPDNIPMLRQDLGAAFDLGWENNPTGVEGAPDVFGTCGLQQAAPEWPLFDFVI